MSNFQVTLNQTWLGEVVKNVMNFQTPNNDPTTLVELADGLRAAYVTDIVTFLGQNWTLDSVTFREFNGSPPFSQEVPFTQGPLNGGNGSEGMPPEVALLVTTTYLGSAPNRGRIYLPGGCINLIDDGRWSTGFTAAGQNLVTAFINGIPLSVGSAFLRIARIDDVNNVWTLDNPAETAIARTNTGSMRSRSFSS